MRKITTGVSRFQDVKFPICAGLLIFSCLCFAEQGYGVDFVWAQLFFAALISFIVVSTFAWQWRVFGNPQNPATLTLHLLWFMAMLFFVNRLFMKEDNSTLLDIIASVGQSITSKLVSFIPEFIFDILRSPGAPILLAAVTATLLLPRRFAAASLVFILSVAVLMTVTQSQFKGVGWFIIGNVAMAVSLFMQRDDPVLRHFWSRVLDRLGDDKALRGDLIIKTRILDRLQDIRRPLTERECIGIVSRAVGQEPTAPESRAIAARVVRNLTIQDHICAVVLHEGRYALAPSHETFRSEEQDIWGAIAAIPKSVAILAFALVWILSPIDLIPDTIPIFGVCDDVGIGILAAISLRKAVNARAPTLLESAQEADDESLFGMALRLSDKAK